MRERVPVGVQAAQRWQRVWTTYGVNLALLTSSETPTSRGAGRVQRKDASMSRKNMVHCTIPLDKVKPASAVGEADVP